MVELIDGIILTFEWGCSVRSLYRDDCGSEASRICFETIYRRERIFADDESKCCKVRIAAC